MVQGWGEDLTARFEAGEFDVAHLLFSKFVTVLTQEPTAIQLVPVAVATDGTVPSVGASVEYEPDEEEILADLLPRNVSVQLLRANRDVHSCCRFVLRLVPFISQKRRRIF